MTETKVSGRAALAVVETTWNSAAGPWNPEALAAAYTYDALFFGGRPGHAVGTTAIRDYFASYDGIIERGSMELVEQHIVELTPVVVLAQGYVNFSFELSGNRSTVSFLRTTLVIVWEAGEWRIRQHHFSAQPLVPPLGDS